MSFDLDATKAKLLHLNARKEGDEGEVAVDLKIEFTTLANEVLLYFAPTLSSFLFEGDRVRFPLMGPVKWAAVFEGMHVSLDDLKLSAAKLHKFEIVPLIAARQIEMELVGANA